MRTLATFALFASLYSFIFVSHQFIIFPVSPRAVVECRSGWPAPPASPGIQSMLQSGLPAGQPPSHTHKLSLGIILILVPTYSKLWLTIKLILHFSPLRRRNIFFDVLLVLIWQRRSATAADLPKLSFPRNERDGAFDVLCIHNGTCL